MGRELQLNGMIGRLNAASSAKNWVALIRINRELEQMLLEMPAPREWSPRESAAISTLRKAHAAALEQCRKEAERTRENMEKMSKYNEVLKAYAMTSDSAGGEI